MSGSVSGGVSGGEGGPSHLRSHTTPPLTPPLTPSARTLRSQSCSRSGSQPSPAELAGEMCDPECERSGFSHIAKVLEKTTLTTLLLTQFSQQYLLLVLTVAGHTPGGAKGYGNTI